MAFDEYEEVFVSTVVRGEDAVESDSVPLAEKANTENELFGDEDNSMVSNDESVCQTNNRYIRNEDSDDDDDENDGEILLTREERDERLAVALKKLGNMTRKPLNKYATVDIFVRGKLTLGNLAKTRKAEIDKSCNAQPLDWPGPKIWKK